MHALLLKYNKVHNDSLRNLSVKLTKHFNVSWGDLSKFGNKMDLLSFEEVKNYFNSFEKLDAIVIGDVFWRTGQSICRYGKEHDVSIIFLQHGQWIYVQNKKRLNYYPAHTLLFGDNVGNMCSSWVYGKNSQISVTGSPRYDNASPNGGSYVYFSPPVIEELIHGRPSGRVRSPFLNNLEAIKKLDKELQIVIQPHYRETRTNLLHQFFPHAQFADPTLDALKLLRGAAKVLTSRNSTVVLDAIAHQKPVVLMDFPEHDDCFFRRGYFKKFAVESNNKTHLIDNLLNETKAKLSDYNKEAKEYIYLGNASNRIVEIIKASIIKNELLTPSYISL